MDLLKMYSLLKMGIFHCYVSLPEGNHLGFLIFQSIINLAKLLRKKDLKQWWFFSIFFMVQKSCTSCWGWVVYPIIYDGFHTSKRWLFGLSSINGMSLSKWLNFLINLDVVFSISGEFPDPLGIQSPCQMMIGTYNHRNETQGIEVPWNHSQVRWARIPRDPFWGDQMEGTGGYTKLPFGSPGQSPHQLPCPWLRLVTYK